MMFQSIGKSGRALFLSALRTGLCFIPLIEVLPLYLGLTGIEIAQPISDITAAMISVPFAVSFLRQLKARKEPGEIQAAPVPEKKECWKKGGRQDRSRLREE